MAPCDWIKDWAKNFGAGTAMLLILASIAAAFIGVIYGIAWLYTNYGVKAIVALALPVAVVILSIFGRHVRNS